MTHSAVLNELGCGDLGSLLDPAFCDEFGLVSPGQYGIVVQDVPKCIDSLRAAGASEFLHVTTRPPSWSEPGVRPEDVCVELALGYSNHQQIELLGSGEGTRLYQPVIRADGRPALHHVCIFQKGIEEIETRLNCAGFPTVVAGDFGMKGVFTSRFRYFDTRERLGIYLEVTEYLLFTRHAPPAERLVRWAARRQGRFAGEIA